MRARAARWLLAAAGMLAACSGERTTGTPIVEDITTVRSALTTIAVTVSNTSGAAQAGVLVHAQSESTWLFVQTQTTNAQGVATFSLENDSYLFATPGQPANYYFFTSSACQTPSCTSAALTVTTPVMVTVVDTEGVPQADVQVLAEDPGGNFVNYNYTGASGQAPVSVLPGTYGFAVPGSGTGFFFRAPACTVPGCTATTVTVTRPVTVTVVNSAGTPMADVQVLAEGASGYVNLDTTGAQGQVVLSVPVGSYRFVAPLGSGLYPSGPGGSCAVPGCTTATIVIPDPVVVTVVDGQGQPIADQTVLAQPAGGGGGIIEATDAAGHATFTLAVGAWRFQASCGSEVFWSGNEGSCVLPGCTSASITMICGACAGQPNGTTCNDANPCTQTDACQAGSCVGSNPIACSGDQCRGAGACDMQTGACSSPARPDGAACDDGNACTAGDVCSAGSCQGAAPFTCMPPDTCHDNGTCDSSRPLPTPPSTQDMIGWWKLDGNGTDATGGGHDLTNEGAVPAPGRSGMAMRFDGTSCMTAPIWDEARMQGANGVTVMAWIHPDTYACTEQYDMNAVVGRGWDYSIGSWCYLGVASNYAQGINGAVRPVNAAGWGYGGGYGIGSEWHHVVLTWDHQTVTTYLDGQGLYAYPMAEDISDFDPMFAVGCLTSYYWSGDERIHHFRGAVDEVMLYRRALTPQEIASYYAAADPCTHGVFADATPCSDNNFCTQGETCSSGTCGGGAPVTCTAPDSCHAAATCVWWAGCHEPPAKADGATCNDGAACTQSETCQAGSCQASATFPPVLNLPTDDLGTLGGTQVFADDNNASGQIVGSALDAAGLFRAYMRTGTAPMAALPITPPSYATAINDAGMVTGSLTLPDGSHAFRYSATGGLQDLGLGGDGSVGMDNVVPYQGSYAFDINNSNQVAGVFTEGGAIRGFRFSDAVGFEDIGSLQGGLTGAWGIADSGTVVGSSWVAGTPTGIRRLGHAVRFDDAMVGLFDLNGLVDPTAGWTLITANAIAGDYVAGIGDHGGKVSAFRLRLSTGVVDDLSGGWEGSTYAYGLNAEGQVGGWGSPTADDNGQAAFVYTDQLGFKKLNDMIDPASGWDLRSVGGINASGEIVGWGYHNGQLRAFRLRLPQGQAATCQARGVCGGGDGDAICLFSDGVVETSPGHFVAVFGFDNASSTSVQPAVNQVRLDGSLVANPQPAPPANLSSGTHTGAFLPTFDDGHAISWTVGGETVTASASSPRLQPVPLSGGGLGVVIGGTTIVVKALEPILEGVATVGSLKRAIFSYRNIGSASTNIPYGDQNFLSTESGVVTAPPSPPPTWFLPGMHRAVFAPMLATQSLSWTLGTRTVTADSSSPALTIETRPEGTGLVIDGEFVAFTPDPDFDLTDPDPPAQVGAVKGDLSVDDAGQAVYSVPMNVPIGVNGHAPKLSFGYRSSGRNGPLGMGWSLGGLSAIHRCSKTSGQDGAPGPVNDDETDRFCWDGRRLVATAGAYGQAGTEYRTEMDAFARIVSVGDPGSGASYRGPQYFEVRAADGKIFIFGEHPFGSTDAVELTVGNVRRTWALRSIKDRSDNIIDFSYYNDACGDDSCIGTLLPKEITYSNRRIAFLYGTRDDRQASFVRGVRRFVPRRLTRVQMFVGTEQKWYYRLDYRDNLAASHIEKIFECAGNTLLCKPATTFAYGDAGVPDVGQPTSHSVLESFGNGRFESWYGSTVVLDANGDGRDDLLSPGGADDPYTYRLRLGQSDPNVPFAPEIDTGLISGYGNHVPNLDLPAPFCFSQGSVVDLNNDGRDDLVSQCFQRDVLPARNGWAALISTGTGFERIDLPVPLPTDDINFYDRVNMADLDGDGLKDVLACDTAHGSAPPSLANDHFMFYRNLGPGLGFAPGAALPSLDAGCHVQILLIDADGDGTADVLRPARNVFFDEKLGIPFDEIQPWKALVQVASDPHWIDTGIQTRYVLSEVRAQQHPHYPDGVDPSRTFPSSGRWFMKPIDYNGDGLLDLLQYSYSEAPGNRVSLHVNTGRGFNQVSMPLELGDELGKESYAFFRAEAVDWNHDGRQDLLVPYGSPALDTLWNLHISYDRGGPFLAPIPINTAGELAQNSLPVLADHDGDGDQEILYADFSTGHLYNWETKAADQHLLREIVDGVGRAQTIDYNAEAHSPTPIPRTTARLVRRVYPLVLSTTESITTSPPGSPPTRSPLRSTRYSYRDATAGFFSRGWLGFASIGQTKTDETSASHPMTSTVTRSFDNTTLIQELPGVAMGPFYPFAGVVVGRDVSYPAYGPLNGPGTGPSRVRSEQIAVMPEVRVSQDGRPFIHRATTTTTIRELNYPVPPYFVISQTSKSADVDGYGNITSETATWRNSAGQVLETRVTSAPVDITPHRRNAWLIRSPDSRSVTSTTDEGTATREWAYTYYPDGKPHTVTREPNRADARLVTSMTYDAFGNPATAIRSDSTGRQRTDLYVHDPTGVTLTRHTDAADMPWRYTFDSARGTLLREIDPNGLISGQAIDAFGRVTRVGTPTTITKIKYGLPDATWGLNLGQLAVTRSTAGGEQMTEVLDSLGRQIQTRTSGYFGQVVIEDRFYDWADRVVLKLKPHLPGTSQALVMFSYDSLGRPSSVTDTDEGAPFGLVTTTYGYESINLGQVSQAAPYTAGWDAYATKHTLEVVRKEMAGSVSVQGKGQTGKVVAATDANGGVTHYRYAAFDLPSSVRDPAGNATGIVHDPPGRRTFMSDPDMGPETTVYNGFDEPEAITDAAGTQTLIHDALGRLTARSDAAGNKNRWVFDGSGPAEKNRLVETFTELPSGLVTAYERYTYFGSGYGRGQVETLTRAVGGLSFLIRTTYDGAGRVDEIHYPNAGGGFAIRHLYDSAGHTTGVRDLSSNLDYWKMLEADQGYRIGLEEFGNEAQTRQTYKPASGRLDVIDTTAVVGGTRLSVQKFGYVYDARGNVKDRIDHLNATESRSYQYDALDRLRFVNGQSGQIENFDYDAIGNIRFKSGVGEYRYESPRPHAVTTAGTSTYQYDGRGNQFVRSGPDVSGGVQTIDYTSFGMPAQVRGASDVVVATFRYDASDRRVRMTTPSDDRFFAGDLYEEYRSNGDAEYRYHVFANGREVAQVTRLREGSVVGPDVVRYIHSDGLGSTTGVSNSASVLQRVHFDAFGAVRAEELNAAAVTPGFTGHRHDGELGLIDMKGRLYDSTIGRFISPDPFVAVPYLSQALDRYSYVYNNPVKYQDPTGFAATGGCTTSQEAYNCPGYETVVHTGTPDESLADQVRSDMVRFEDLGGTGYDPSEFTNPFPTGTEGPLADRFTGATEPGADVPSGYSYQGDDTPPKEASAAVGLAAAAGPFALAAGAPVLGGLVLRFAFGTGVRVFWSGGTTYAGAAAARWAALNGARTLGMTPAGRLLTAGIAAFGYKLMSPVTNFLSGRFASTAVGDVHFFMSLSRIVSPQSIWLRIELPALLQNPSVQNIGVHFLP